MHPVNPYRYIHEMFPGVQIRAADLGTDWGLTQWDEHGKATVYYSMDLGAVQRRCVLFHEARHLARGAPCKARCPIDEADCREATARWLLPDIEELGGLMSLHPVAHVAEQMEVLTNIINDRIDNFSDDELARYRACFAPIARSTSDAACNSHAGPRRTVRNRSHPCRRVLV
jgi:hypothetical protein